MTLKELCDNIHICARLKVVEVKTNKVLADPYNVYEHKCLEDRIIYGIWASIENYGYIFDYSCPIICCYVLESDEDNKNEI